MKKNNIKSFIMIFLMISLVFILPLDFNHSFANAIGFAKETTSKVGGTHNLNDESQLCGANQGMNVKSSLILSIVTLCLPGILEKVYQWNQIKCQEITCMYDAVIYDQDPSFCAKTKSYEVCTQIIGEAFALPPLAILEYYKKLIASILANPAGLLWSVAYEYGKHSLSVGKGLPAPIIGPTAIFVGVTNIARAAQDIMDILKNGFFPPGVKDGEDYCKRVPEIKKEMEKILESETMIDVKNKVK